MSYSFPLYFIAILHVLCCESFGDQDTSSQLEEKNKGRARKLLAGAAGAAGPSLWNSDARPYIFISGQEGRHSQQGLREATRFFATYNEGSNPHSLNELRFAFIGDQGGTGGVPSQQYIDTVASIAARHSRVPYHAIFTVGDNVYSEGITAQELAVLDRLTAQIWEAHGAGLNNIPWFAVLGNHDHYKDPMAQVLYSREQITRALRNAHRGGLRHPIWILPDLYYDVVFQFGANNKHIHFLMVDSMIERAENDKYSGCHHATRDEIQSKKDRYKRDLKPEQHAFIRSRLTNPHLEMMGVDFRAVMTHHAPFSTMKWRGCDDVLKLVNTICDTHPVDAVFAGHDHAFEYGYTTNPFFHNSVIGGTRSCEALGYVNGLKQAGSDFWNPSRPYKGFTHWLQGKYRSYWWRVYSGFGGWRGCNHGGFAEVVFEDVGKDAEVKASMRYFDGFGTQLYPKMNRDQRFPSLPIGRGGAAAAAADEGEAAFVDMERQIRERGDVPRPFAGIQLEGEEQADPELFADQSGVYD